MILSPTVVAMDGVFVEFDDTGDGTLVDFLITLAPTGLLGLDERVVPGELRLRQRQQAAYPMVTRRTRHFGQGIEERLKEVER